MRQKVRWNIEMSVALFFIEKKFFPLFIGVCGLFWACDGKCDEKKFCRRIIAFYFCACKPEDAQNQFASAV